MINVNNTISGAGAIGTGGPGAAPLTTITNETAGVIDATDATTALILDTAGAGAIINEGLIEGTGRAGLTIDATSVQNAGGTILAGKGSRVDLTGNANVTGGTLSSVGSGAIYIDSGASFGTLTSTALVRIGNGDALFLSGTLTNSGVIALTG